jgi:hypothetical protein
MGTNFTATSNLSFRAFNAFSPRSHIPAVAADRFLHCTHQNKFYWRLPDSISLNSYTNSTICFFLETICSFLHKAIFYFIIPTDHQGQLAGKPSQSKPLIRVRGEVRTNFCGHQDNSPGGVLILFSFVHAQVSILHVDYFFLKDHLSSYHCLCTER